jgi:hypothetical protein
MMRNTKSIKFVPAPKGRIANPGGGELKKNAVYSNLYKHLKEVVEVNITSEKSGWYHATL